MRICAVGGCVRRTEGYGRYCTSHKARDRRHGHPEQKTIRKADLKPYIAHIQDRLSRRENLQDIWRYLEAVWSGLIKLSEGEVRAYENGRPSALYMIGAYRDILKIAGSVDTREAILTILAMAYMLQDDMRLFKCDRSFWIQTARRFRTLGDVHVAEYWHNGEGRVKRVYRDASRRQAAFLGNTLMTVFGAYGVKIGLTEKKEQAATTKLTKATMAALDEGAG